MCMSVYVFYQSRHFSISWRKHFSHTHTHIYIYIHILRVCVQVCTLGILGVMVTVEGNEHRDTSSNLEW